MNLSLLSRPRVGSGKAAPTSFRPWLEGLEDRVTPATMNLPLAVESVQVVGTGDNQALLAIVSLAGQAPKIVPITAATVAQQGTDCPILHLQLNPIHLNLLGLHVDTSQICLDVTATPSSEGGGLLGDLLCGLGGGLDLGGIVSGIGTQLNSLLGQLDNLLDGALGQQLTVDQVFGAHDSGVCTGECEILDLSLGPVDLSLLGLNVSLDDCNGGPVQVCVSATASEGLLGNLLCGLADGPLAGGGLGGLVGRIDNLIDRLGDLADRLGQLDNLPDLGKLEKRIDKLIDKLEKVADRVDSLQDLDHLIKQVEHTVDQLDRLIDRID